MKKSLAGIVCAVLVFSLAGCGANFNSAFRKFDVTKSESVSIDAKQRVVTTGQRAGYAGTNTNAEGKAEPFRVDAQAVTCAEPSPDALSVLGASFGGSASDSQNLALKIVGATTESGASIGLRTQTIQILRDAMFRLCEGYQSGALSSQAFERLQRRYQNAMLGLLAVEQLTGAVVAKQPSISANAPANTDPFGSDPKAGDNKKPAPGADPAAGDKPAANPKPAADAKAAPNAAATTKPPADPQNGASARPVSDVVGAKVADTVLSIVTAVLSVDYTRETCLNYLIDETGKFKDLEVINFCKQLLNLVAEKASGTKDESIFGPTFIPPRFPKIEK